MIPLVLAIHTVAAVVWVGGMFFAVTTLHPALGSLPLEARLTLQKRVLERFFHWVAISIVTLLATGYGVVFFGYQGFATAGLHIHIMQATGLTMVLLFILMWSMPWQEFRHAINAGQTEAAAKALARIRLIMRVNLGFGLFTAAIGATGGFWTY